MRILLLIIGLTVFTSPVMSQKSSDSLSRHFIGIEATGLFLNSNPGIKYYFEYKSLQVRAHFQYSMSTKFTPDDSADQKTVTHNFIPMAGAAWVTTRDRFAFYIGNDFYYRFYKSKTNYDVKNILKYKFYGFEPTIGFRFPLHPNFYIGLEGKSTGSINEIINIETNKKASSFNFSLLSQYGILIFYKF